MKSSVLFDVLSMKLPEEFVLVQEAPSEVSTLKQSRIGSIEKPNSYYTMSSGGLGWDMPAAVGLALAEKKSGRHRPVIAIMGDGSFQYSPQSIWTGVQHELAIVVIVLRNEEYGILKAFAELEGTPNVPGLDLPGLCAVSLAKAYGAEAFLVETKEEIEACFLRALKKNTVTVIEVPIDKAVIPLASSKK
jgi:benzoylformate decarboxylase